MTASPRSRAAAQIQDAAWEILAERGLPGVTMEEIAARAGVAKTTVYRWWPTKSAVLMDALRERLLPRVAFPEDGSVRDDLVSQIEAVIDLFGSETGRAYLALVAESMHDGEVATALRERYVDDQRRAAIERLEKGKRKGEVLPEVDLELLVDSLYGALYYRVLVSHAPLDRAYARRLVDGIWPGEPNRRRPAGDDGAGPSTAEASMI
ncbi:TetR/AcrR family transcriptional regulator [Microbacterium sp.]|uniref:TetR/AcrR family transcriptional regulator n=1 Tax=Microbacterium sp. TaxID=51671 RepID=UPI003340C02F